MKLCDVDDLNKYIIVVAFITHLFITFLKFMFRYVYNKLYSRYKDKLTKIRSNNNIMSDKSN
jgi:hypothetical protein